jgi:hypothetical protein
VGFDSHSIATSQLQCTHMEPADCSPIVEFKLPLSQDLLRESFLGTCHGALVVRGFIPS